MIGHMLNMYVLQGAGINYKTKEVEVMVTQDRWEYARGRDIQFMAVGLPDTFAFVVEEQRNVTPDALIRTGDCRQGSWAGIASKIGVNQYQGTESTGVANSASGLIAFGTNTRFDLGTVQDRQQTARVALGEKINMALVRAYASGYSNTITQNQKLKSAPYSYADVELPPDYYHQNTFGTALDAQTKTVRSSPAEVRQATYERTGEILTTAFSSYGEGKIGGLTFLGKGIKTGVDKMRNISIPLLGNGLGEAERGGQPNAVWSGYTIAGGRNTSPFNIHFLRMDVAANGDLSFQRAENGNPSASGQGDVWGWHGYTMYSDDLADTADTPENRQLLTDTYLASKARETIYKINYPICVPVRFSTMVSKDASYFQRANMWTTEADFINHNYTIGGK